MSRPLRLVLCVLGLALLSCTSPDIYQDPSFNPPVRWGSHRVQPGESLHSIAWRYGRDFRELAAENDIAPPYRVYPNQLITLEDTGAWRPASAPPASPRAQPPVKKAPQGPVSTASNKKTQTAKAPITKHTGKAPSVWRWPHAGPIIEGFSNAGYGSKGIDIAGKEGDPIVAAAAGEVVYAGSGLLGYGRLVIITHNEEFLSAYAHNSKILVAEGGTVKAGDPIAEMGSSGTNRVKLHFEVRKRGVPVDPKGYLPKR